MLTTFLTFLPSKHFEISSWFSFKYIAFLHYLLLHACMYIHIYNKTCSICIICILLFMCLFSGLTIWYCITSWCALAWGRISPFYLCLNGQVIFVLKLEIYCYYFLLKLIFHALIVRPLNSFLSITHAEFQLLSMYIWKPSLLKH